MTTGDTGEKTEAQISSAVPDDLGSLREGGNPVPVPRI